ncbi:MULTISPECIES: acyl carrier protein [unclassified Streptomyces]|uniref:acyl carrier protein n=1 Tax=unclassified Streptomyces TaxID=2593676 RepID=UPI00224F2AA9|nr:MULTISPECIES: acyl carrier protein [unclassified Streptomyces]MCX5138799.1 acyl carrier protein [Streptomyces sp. NBC_00338]WRZ63512.1 acyl carrier protein [Streptomyces sp. NBC_01257]WSU57477.1 acyl carrier protein [Streptomyces sp. NBC_01104]
MWDEQFDILLRKQLSFLPPDEPITEDMRLRDYGLDSLGMIELLAGLEAAYDVRFRDEALSLEIFETPDVLWDALQRLR